MGKILCATRGGEASYRAQDAAITIAKEQGDSLVFLYVIDTHFLDKTAAPILVDPEDGLAKMGEFLLLMAKERAAKQSIEAETISRRGEVRQVLKETAQDEEVDLIVLGSPSGQKSVFNLKALEDFAAEIETETGIKTKIV
ncbi:MAG: universal stress protein [Anaerolineales bacterium]|jgi:nucleotide-binding universal stress UspA family protein